jgi:hypothetical protein
LYRLIVPTFFTPNAHDEPENSTEDRQTTPLGGESGRND